MVTYKHFNEVARNRCLKRQAKRLDSKAILLEVATSDWALIIWIIKKTQILVIKQTK